MQPRLAACSAVMRERAKLILGRFNNWFFGKIFWWDSIFNFLVKYFGEIKHLAWSIIRIQYLVLDQTSTNCSINIFMRLISLTNQLCRHTICSLIKYFQRLYLGKIGNMRLHLLRQRAVRNVEYFAEVSKSHSRNWPEPVFLPNQPIRPGNFTSERGPIWQVSLAD